MEQEVEFLLDYWRRRCRDGRPPTRADIDPAELGPLLPWLMMAERGPTLETWRFRLVGTVLSELWGGRLEGPSFADLRQAGGPEPNPDGADPFVDFAACCAVGRPILARIRFCVGHALWHEAPRLLLPLASSGEEEVCDRVLGLFLARGVFAGTWRGRLTAWQELSRVEL